MNVNTTRDGGPSTTSLIVTFCSLVYFLDGLLHSILGPLAPDIARSLALTPAELGPIFSANLAGQCVGLIALPLLADRVGQRAVILVSLIGFGAAQCGSASAESAAALIAWRGLTGIFLGGCLPSCLALVTAVSPARRRGFVIMVMFTGYGLGATVAGLVATAFAGSGGWRATTLVTGAACLATAVAAWRWMPDRPDLAQVDESPAARRVESGALQLLTPQYLLTTGMLWLLFICMLTISYCLNSWLPTLLVKVGRNESFAALSVSIFSLGGIVAALGVGLLIDRFGAARTLVTFLSISTVLLWTLGQLLASASASLLTVLLVTSGFFVLGAYGGVNVVLATAYPPALRAVGIGWTKSVGRVGTLIAPILIGGALSAGVAETSILSLFALPALLAALALAVVSLRSAGRAAA